MAADLAVLACCRGWPAAQLLAVSFAKSFWPVKACASCTSSKTLRHRMAVTGPIAGLGEAGLPYIHHYL